VEREPRYSGPHVNYLPLVLTAAFSITLAANGFSLVAGLPFLATMAVAGFLFAVKMRLFLGNDYGDEETRYNSRSLPGYAALAVLFLALGAFGLFGYSGRSSAEMLIGQTAPLFDQRRNNTPFQYSGEDGAVPKRESARPRPVEWGAEATLPGEWFQPAPLSGSGPAAASVVEALKIGSFFGFIQSTLAKHTFAIICWIAAVVLEFFILMLLRQVQFEQDYD
jgi:hypothetical protein